jgi:hypothetical protein
VEITDTGSTLQGEEPLLAMHSAPKREGAGLGLATIQTVVSDHGGQMFVEAIPGTGTAFRMDFPVAPNSARVPQVENASPASKRQPEPKTEPKVEQARPSKPEPPAKPEQPHEEQVVVSAARPKSPIARMIDI